MSGRYELARHFGAWTVIDHAHYDAERPIYLSRAQASARCDQLNRQQTNRMNPAPTLFDKDPDMPEPTPPPSIWDEFPKLPDDDEVPAGVDRDRYKRPLIIPPGGGKPVPYTRVSTFASYLDNAHGLMVWKCRNVALGIARHDDLRRMVAGLAYGDELLDEHIEAAMVRMDDKAAWGTAIHSFTEPNGSPYIPEEMLPDVRSYEAAVEHYGLTVKATELFVVNDELRVAGTLDHIYGVPGIGNAVGDKKTGKVKAHSVGIQEGCYANSSVYDPSTGERKPLKVSRETGLLIHIPKEEGRTEVLTVNIAKGYAAAKLALAVQGYSTDKDICAPLALPNTAAA